MISILPVRGLPQIRPGDDIADLFIEACKDNDIRPSDWDVLVVTQKIVSKAEGRLVTFDPKEGHKPLVEQESKRILRRRGDLIISETNHGFVCANAGIDLSNVEEGQAALLPLDSDRSAKRIQSSLEHKYGMTTGVIISDTFGRPWRRGVTDVAIGSAGIKPIIDLRGTTDSLGRELQVTEVAVADELAAAAELVMGKAENVPIAIVRGAEKSWFGEGSVSDSLVRNSSEDLFR
tara:strand:+ start:5187 stop:5888 length:702 start_codon:yes stop_codon:yes gene_type:complete